MYEGFCVVGHIKATPVSLPSLSFTGLSDCQAFQVSSLIAMYNSNILDWFASISASSCISSLI